MGIFESEEQKARERLAAEERVRTQAKDSEYQAKLAAVRFFPGSMVEYEQVHHCLIEAIPTGCPDEGVRFMRKIETGGEGTTGYWGHWTMTNVQLRNKLIDLGIEAIVNAHRSNTTWADGFGGGSEEFIYGLPVRKRQDAPAEKI